jgi:hypothetical protein
MIPHQLVTRYVDRQKDELLSHLWANNALAPSRAIDLSAFPVKRSILQEMINRKIVLRASSGRYYLDPSRMDRAYGASGKFVLYAIGVMVLFILVIALL